MTKRPHPVAVIDNALSAAKIRVDPEAPAEAQVKAAHSKLLEQIKLKRSEIEGKFDILFFHVSFCLFLP